MRFKVNNQVYVTPVMDDEGHICNFIQRYRLDIYDDSNSIVNAYYFDIKDISKDLLNTLLKFDFIDTSNNDIMDLYEKLNEIYDDQPVLNNCYDVNAFERYIDIAIKFYPDILHISE